MRKKLAQSTRRHLWVKIKVYAGIQKQYRAKRANNEVTRDEGKIPTCTKIFIQYRGLTINTGYCSYSLLLRLRSFTGC